VGVTYAPGTVNLLDETAVAAFLAQIDRGDLGPTPAVVVFDTLKRMTAGGDLNSGEEGGLVVSACEQVQRATGAAVIIGHHTPWDPDKQRPKGDSTIPDCADAVYLLENKDGALKLVNQKMRDAEQPSTLHLKLTPHDGALVIDKGTTPPTAVEELCKV